MTKKGLRTCCVCHKEYSFCLCNPEDRNKEPWHFAYCSENCKDIYAATSDYECGKITANEAKEQLDKLDLSQIANFGESYQKAIVKINDNFVPVKPVVQSEVVISENEISEKAKVISNKNYRKPRVKNEKTDGEVE